MSYGCHPATGGACDCDWDTDERGHDYFVQCDRCAELWEKFPAAEWGCAEGSIEEDSDKVLRILNEGDLEGALSKVVELGLLHASPVLRELFQQWLPVLLDDPDVVKMMGGTLRACADSLVTV